MIQHIEHVGLSVSNLERSIEFYCENMGLTLERILEPSPDLPLDVIVGMPGCRVESLNLEWRDPSSIDLHEYDGREDEGVKVVYNAGEILYRVQE